MKSLVALFAGEISGYGLEPAFGGASAFERSLSWARAVPDVSRIVVFARDGSPVKRENPAFDPLRTEGLPCDLRLESQWTASSFFNRLVAESEGFDHVFLAWADCPFLDTAISLELYKKHKRYAAEYTFADGYPYGLTPEILARGIVPIIATLAADNQGPVTRSLVFDTIKKDINSFDIETDIAPVDLRQLRLTLACDTKRNALLCKALEGIDCANYGDLVVSRSSSLRTLPAFYAIQVAGACPFECSYCPYPEFCRSGKGSSPGKKATDRSDEMSVENFRIIVQKIADFSEDAVISLSLWGECAYHGEIATLVEIVLSHPGLSVLIETTGISWKKEALDAIAALSASCALRTNGQKPVSWIVSLDAVGSACYGSVHGLSSKASDPPESEALLRRALSFTELTDGLFPGAVWPQMVRMNDNEVELEAFYRFWKQKTDRVIIQKHDHFCRSIEDRRVADLSPLVRNPCWHLKRDMSILMDGKVPLCREDIYASRVYGNAVTDDFASIWSNGQPIYEQHALCNYEGMCGACDEYYTYNF